MTRVFVADPACAQQIGHNLSALRFFISFVGGFEKIEQVVGLCASTLESAVDGTEIDPFFNFNYYHLISVEPNSFLDQQNVLSDMDFRLRSTADFTRLFSKYTIDETCIIFMPSADYFGILGLMSVLKNLDVKKSPRVILRMISVLDYAARYTEGAEQTCLSAISDAISAGHSVELVAETPAYASALSSSLGAVIPVAPYPIIYDQEPIAKDSKVIISALGSGRHDKGFLRLKLIFRTILDHSDDISMKFIVQNLPHKLAKPYLKYIAELSALPGVFLTPEILEQEDLFDYLRRSRVIVAPYAQDVYAMRGSAILMEALSVGRPIVGEADCGFSSQISFYDCGKVCKTEDEYANRILEYARMDVDELNIRMTQARSRFLFDSQHIYSELLNV